MKQFSKIVLATVLTTLLAGAATSAMAESQWSREHPRRHEVNSRLARQNHRIHRERREGELSATQARQLHHEDHQIRHEEHAMAAQNGGHIIRAETRALNQQENGVSRQIGQ